MNTPTIEQVYINKKNYVSKVIWSWYKYQPDLIEDVKQESWLWLTINIHKYSYDRIPFDHWLRMNLIYFLHSSKHKNRAFYRSTHTHFDTVEDLQLFDNTQEIAINNFEENRTIRSLCKNLTEGQKRIIEALLQDNDVSDLSRIFRKSKQNMYKRFKLIKSDLRRVNV